MAPPLAEALFAPRSIALIGASDDAAKVTARPLRLLRLHGFGGAVYPVNPRRAQVLGEHAYPGLDAIDGTIDHAFILVPTAAVEAAVADCAAAGVQVATILADGFGEAGAEGKRAEAELVQIAGRAGLRLVGPNSLGIVSTHAGLALTANAAFLGARLPQGGMSLISQSGNMLGTLFTRAAARGLGFAKMISAGNEADLDAGEIGDLLVSDPETEVILLFLEAVRRRESFAAFLEHAHSAEKPVIALRVGRSEAGRAAAFSHTGALVGSGAALDALLGDLGVIQVRQFEALLEAVPLARQAPPATPLPQVAIVTTTGGAASLIADRLGLLGITLAPVDEAMVARLAARGVEVRPGPLLDLTLAGARADLIAVALEEAARPPDVALVIAVIGSSAAVNPEAAVGELTAQTLEKPVVAFVAPEAAEAMGHLAAAGIAAFRTPEACADAVSAVLRRRAPRFRIGRAAGDEALTALVADASNAKLDEAESLKLFAVLGVPTAEHARIALDAPPPELAISFPVAVKALAPELAHKSEAGGVILDVADAAALADALDRIRRAVPGAREALVQPMERGLAEVIVGYRDDPQAGPVVTIGIGGVLTELRHDIAVRLAPVDEATAREMIAEVKGLAPLRGYRNLPRGDLAALAAAVAAISRLARTARPRVIEAEINPLVVRGEGLGVVAVDGLVRLAPGGT